MNPVPRRYPPSALLLMVAGCLGFAAAWVLAAAYLERQAAWLAPMGALDAVLMLRLGRMPGGARRALLATLATVVTIVAANWGIAALEIGRSMGLLPWESALRLGPAYAWELARLANGSFELACYLLALAAAFVAGR